MKIYKKVKSHLSSAESLFNDAVNLPGALRYNASKVFLLISSWELLVMANEEMSDFLKTRNLDQKIYKSHQFKLKDAPKITHIVVNKGIAPIVTEYSGSNLHKVRQLALFGENNISRDDLFMRGWHFNSFTRRLKNKIDLFTIHAEVVENLPKGG